MELRWLSIGFATMAIGVQAQPAVAQYRTLTNEVFFRSADPHEAKAFRLPPRARRDEVATALHDLVQSSIFEHLTMGTPSSDSMQKALTDLQGEYSLALMYPRSSNAPFAALANINGFPTLATAFGIVTGGIGIPEIRTYVQFYSHAAGVWKLTDELGGDFGGTAISMRTVQSAVPSELWYLVWGKTIGDTAARVKLRLYGFDGWNVREIWRRDDLRGGIVSVVAPDKVTIDYFEPQAADTFAPPRHCVDTLRPGQTGLEISKTEFLNQ